MNRRAQVFNSGTTADDPRVEWSSPEALEELADKLRTSVPDGADDRAQAVEMLCNAYGGALLAMPRIQDYLVPDGDRIRIQWNALAGEVKNWEGSAASFRANAGIPSAAAHHIIRLAYLLHTGELTSHELGIIGDAYRNAAGPQGERAPTEPTRPSRHSLPSEEDQATFERTFPDWGSRPEPFTRSEIREKTGIADVKVLGDLDHFYSVARAMKPVTNVRAADSGKPTPGQCPDECDHDHRDQDEMRGSR